MAAKDQEIRHLQDQIDSFKREYEKIYGTKMENMAELQVYNSLIVPEIQRMRRLVALQNYM